MYENQNNQVDIRCSGAYGQPIKQLSKNELNEEIVDVYVLMITQMPEKTDPIRRVGKNYKLNETWWNVSKFDRVCVSITNKIAHVKRAVAQ